MRYVKVRSQILYRLPDGGLPFIVLPTVPLQIVDLELNNVSLLSAFRDEGNIRFFRGILTDGHALGIAAVCDGTVVAHAWSSVFEKPTKCANGYLKMEAGDALIHDCHVRDEWRGKRIYQNIIGRLACDLLDIEGVRRILIDTESDNSFARQGIISAGFTCVSRVTVVQLLDHTIYYGAARET